jgi:3-oxoacyl-[acyl-carrier protein] reductase
MQEAARRMRDNGRIVNLSSVNTVLAAPLNALYQGTKGAIEQFATVAARELGARGITVNIVSPGATDTDLLRASNPPEALEQLPALIPLGRLGQPPDVANVVAFLCGQDAAWVTGQNLRADGGFP